MGETRRLYWGDLHNHNAVGYAKGSPERTYDIARRHLDFIAFTPHGHWHDMPVMPQNKHLKWVKGFEVTRRCWGDVERLAGLHYHPGTFATFVAYEWHSSRFGDYCVIYPGAENTPLFCADEVTELQSHARRTGALLIPHHPGYRADWRGANFDRLDVGVSPIVEFFSEHGGAEYDRGPFEYLRHSMGGRWTPNTMRSLLARGVRVGVVASTDDHLGYPGAYREGLTGLYAGSLTREGVFEALRARRCFATTGDRIALDFRLNGHWMGEALPPTDHREITIAATGWDEIDRIELLRNNRVIARTFPADETVSPLPWNNPVLCRVEFGWGPWGDLNMDRICDWDFELRIQGGRILDVQGCFRSGPFDENRRNLVHRPTPETCQVRSYTSRLAALGDLVTNAVVLKLAGEPEATLTVTISRPTRKAITARLSDLAASNQIEFTGPFSSESIMLHRLIFAPHYKAVMTVADRREGTSADYYYARVIQANGDMAWSSPIWVDT